MAGESARVEATLAWLRAAHPEARVSALDTTTQPAAVPPELGFAAPQPDPAAPRGLASVDPADRVAVIRAYERARSVRVAVAAARLITGERVHVHFCDLRDTHGVMLVASVPDDGTTAPLAEEGPAVASRVSWSRLDAQGIVLDTDAASVQLFGWTSEEMVGGSALPFIHPDDHDRALENWIDVLMAPGEKRRYRVRHLRNDGSYLWIDVTNHNRLDDPEHGDVLAEMVDVSDEMVVHETLREREQLLRELMDALPVGVLQFDAAGNTVHENEQLRAILGTDRARLDDAVAAVLAGGGYDAVEVHLSGGRVGRVTFRPLLSGGGIACIDDVTEAAQLRRALEVRATFDDLTACFSRSAILGALDDLVAVGPGTGVVFVDLDRFKPVNDELGHAAGDELLATVGARLREAVRDQDLVGRLGGDEFLVVCPGIASAAVVDAIADRVGAAVARPMAISDDHLVRPRASIGVAWAPASTDPTALVARADAAMYEAKRRAQEGTTVAPSAQARRSLADHST